MAQPGFEREAVRLTTVAAIYDRVRTEPPTFVPGARFEYSNSGFIVAGRIIEVVTGQPYTEVVRRRVVDPLGMAGTRFYLTHSRPPAAALGYVPDGRGGLLREPGAVPHPASDGGVHSTVGDLLRLDRALHGPGLLSEESRRLMQTPNLNGYGYGLSIKPPEEHVSRRMSVGHTGGLPDRSSVLRRFVDDGVTLIVLANLPSAAITAVTEIERLYFDVGPGRD
jgi:CubicO group peptidase (beta-lactamase class C family)